MSPTDKQLLGEFIFSLVMLGLMCLGVFGVTKMDKLTKNMGLLGHLSSLSTTLGVFLFFQSFILPEEEQVSRILWGVILIAVGLFIFRKASRKMNENPDVPMDPVPSPQQPHSRTVRVRVRVQTPGQGHESAVPVVHSVAPATTATDASAVPVESHTDTASDAKAHNKKLLHFIYAFILTAFGLLTQTYFVFAGLGWMAYIIFKR